MRASDPAAFGSQVTQARAMAFAGSSQAPRATGPNAGGPNGGRHEALARRIIAVARQGQLDPERRRAATPADRAAG